MSVFTSSVMLFNFEPVFRPTVSFVPIRRDRLTVLSATVSQTAESSLSSSPPSPGSLDQRQIETNASICDATCGRNTRNDLWRKR